jgi:hypothetical protein
VIPPFIQITDCTISVEIRTSLAAVVTKLAMTAVAITIKALQMVAPVVSAVAPATVIPLMIRCVAF